jgi:hypothetical protein
MSLNLEASGEDAASRDVISFQRIVGIRMFLAEQVRSALRQNMDLNSEKLSNGNTDFEQRHDFVEIVILGLVFPYLVYKVSSAPEVDHLIKGPA